MQITNTHLSALRARDAITFENAPAHFIEDDWHSEDGLAMAMDAQPALVSTANAGVLSVLSTVVDPEMLRIAQSPNEAANIFGEKTKGDWTTSSLEFPVVENTGTVEAYNDYSNAGVSNVNFEWEPRQPFLFQTILEYGDQETDRAALAKINLVSEKQTAASKALKRFQNLTYFLGVAGLANYGLLNDPGLGASIAPSIKAAGGTRWVVNSLPNATANEVFNDVQALVFLAVKQSGGLLDAKSKYTLALSPQSDIALTNTNSFGKTAKEMLLVVFPNMQFKTAVQYGALSSQNIQGNASGELVQLIAAEVDGQDTGYCATNAQLRMGRVVPDMSSYKQKALAGTCGAIVRYPAGITSMVGV
jgi:hypothetical protein